MSDKRRKARAAVKRYEGFTGHQADSYTEVQVPVVEVALEVGMVEGRPILAASHDGRQLLLIGGSFEFTDRGITDK